MLNSLIDTARPAATTTPPPPQLSTAPLLHKDSEPLAPVTLTPVAPPPMVVVVGEAGDAEEKHQDESSEKELSEQRNENTEANAE